MALTSSGGRGWRPALRVLAWALMSGVFGAVDCAAAASIRADVDPAEPAVQLPEYTITAERQLPPPESWRYGEIPGIIILTNASDSATQRLIRDFEQFRIALSGIWPLRLRPSLPLRLIVSGSRGRYDQFRPAENSADATVSSASVFYRSRDMAGIVLDLESKVVDLLPTEASLTASGSFEVDSNRQLYREYVHYILSRAEARPAAWLEEGVAQIIMDMDVDAKNIVFGFLDGERRAAAAAAVSADIGGGGAEEGEDAGPPADTIVADAPFNVALSRRKLIEFGKFFSIGHDHPAARNTLGNSIWAKQAYGFVHMCLFGRGKKFQKGFLDFATRSAREPVTEKMFTECFGKTYRQMAEELRGYIQMTDYKHEEFRVPKGQKMPEPAPLVLREATQSEVARLKAEVFLLAGKPEEAHRELVLGYQRGERDAELLAALGRVEIGREGERARKLLEAAFAAKTTNAHAHVALARLRLDEALAAPGGPNGQLTGHQMAPVLRPLFAARELPPALPELYELIAEAWTKSEVAPIRAHLEVIEQGVRLFPRRISLTWAAAQLNAQHGFREPAAALITHGLRTSPDAEWRARFEQLQASLPPPAAAPAASAP